MHEIKPGDLFYARRMIMLLDQRDVPLRKIREGELLLAITTINLNVWGDSEMVRIAAFVPSDGTIAFVKAFSDSLGIP